MTEPVVYTCRGMGYIHQLRSSAYTANRIVVIGGYPIWMVIGGCI